MTRQRIVKREPVRFPPRKPPNYQYINVYEVDRAYGGPEEGGWWYDTGEYVPSLSRRIGEGVTSTSVAAQAEVIRVELADGAQGTPSVGSTQYRGGRYIVRVEDHPGRDFPTERPTYQ